MAGPAFTELRRGEQRVDEAAIGVRRRVTRERFQLLESRRQADQVKVDAACERTTIRGR